jgi:hypothetical protein
MTNEERKDLVRWLRNMQHAYSLSGQYKLAADEIERLAEELQYQYACDKAQQQEIERLGALAQSDTEPVDDGSLHDLIIENYQMGIRPIGLIDEYFGFPFDERPAAPSAGLIGPAAYIPIGGAGNGARDMIGSVISAIIFVGLAALGVIVCVVFACAGISLMGRSQR